MSPLRLLLLAPGARSEIGESTVAGFGLSAEYQLLTQTGEVTAQSLLSLAPDAVLVADIEDDAAALETVRRTRALCANVPIIFLAWRSCEQLAIDAFHSGITRYLRSPWTPSQLTKVLHESLGRRGLQEKSSGIAEPLYGSCPFVGTSTALCELRRYIQQIAPSESNVLITGETGTGKELVAQLIHENSPRRDRPLVCLNSAAIPESLIESELFGYERGAFTGAQVSHEGKLAAANRGTAFLDEIGDISPAVQAKILRAIENKEVFRLGSNRSYGLDVRILAATNQDLESAAAQKRFRSDLYYRLNVIRLDIPPLRNRVEDIPALIDHFIQQFNAKFRKNIAGLRSGSIDLLTTYRWPGNVRELKNLMEAAFVNLPPSAGGFVDLPPKVFAQFSRTVPFEPNDRTRIIRALNSAAWNKTDAARALRCSRMTLYRKMSRYKVVSPAQASE